MDSRKNRTKAIAAKNCPLDKIDVSVIVLNLKDEICHTTGLALAERLTTQTKRAVAESVMDLLCTTWRRRSGTLAPSRILWCFGW